MEHDAQKNANTLNEQPQQKYNLHIKDKEETREKRFSDRKLVDDTKTGICFDFQIVLTCRRANISTFFYIKQIEQTFCTPGHSSNQEVDNIHSHIEKMLKISGIYSPVSLVRVLKKVRPKSSSVLQLMKERFFDFGNAQDLGKTLLPFTKVKYLLFENGKQLHVKYKLCFKDEGSIISIRGVDTKDFKSLEIAHTFMSSNKVERH